MGNLLRASIINGKMKVRGKRIGYNFGLIVIHTEMVSQIC